MQVTNYFFVVHSSHVWLQKWIKGKISGEIMGQGSEYKIMSNGLTPAVKS